MYRVVADHKTIIGILLYEGEDYEAAMELYNLAIKSNTYEALYISHVTTAEIDSWTK